MSNEEFEHYRKRAKKILGYMPMKTPCLVCQTPDGEIPKGAKLPLRSCLVRQCVDKIVWKTVLTAHVFHVNF